MTPRNQMGYIPTTTQTIADALSGFMEKWRITEKEAEQERLKNVLMGLPTTYRKPPSAFEQIIGGVPAEPLSEARVKAMISPSAIRYPSTKEGLIAGMLETSPQITPQQKGQFEMYKFLYGEQGKTDIATERRKQYSLSLRGKSDTELAKAVDDNKNAFEIARDNSFIYAQQPVQKAYWEAEMVTKKQDWDDALKEQAKRTKITKTKKEKQEKKSPDYDPTTQKLQLNTKTGEYRVVPK